MLKESERTKEWWKICEETSLDPSGVAFPMVLEHSRCQFRPSWRANIYFPQGEIAPREKSGIGKTGMVPDSEDDLSVQCLRGGKSGPRTCMSKGTRFHIVDARDQGDTRTKRRMRLLDSSSRKEERERQWFTFPEFPDLDEWKGKLTTGPSGWKWW